ncbi:MAG: hypothetical protein HY940_01795 [Gammaproteobacteria bacterium]|nr:hypothetical protein [Gammaproteobacteria bacterium]
MYHRISNTRRTFYPFSAIAAAIITVNTASAASSQPTTYGGWTVSKGTITAPCPAGILSCSISVADNGFLQRILTLSGGARYIQRIVTEPGANGDPNQADFSADSLAFTMEDFVQMNRDLTASVLNLDKNVSTRFSLAESTFSGSAELRFTYAVRLDNGPQFDSGPAVSNSRPPMWVDSTTTVREIDWSTLSSPVEKIFSSATIRSNSSGFPLTSPTTFGRAEHVFDQRLNLGGADSQQFSHHLLGGRAQTTSHALSAADILPGGSNGGDLAWAVNDTISATWIGQTMTDVYLPDGAATTFGYTGYYKGENTGAAITSGISTRFSSLTSSAPASWVTPFGTAPSMTTPAAITAVAWTAPTALAGTAPAATVLTDTTAGGPPLALDGWSVTNGAITASACTGGAVCGTPLTSSDFYQREVTKDGQRYYQTIVTYGNATGTAASGNESYASLVTGVYDTVTGDYVDIALAPGVLGYANETFVQVGSEGLVSKQQVVSAETARIAYLTDQLGNPLQVPELRPIAETVSYTNALLNTGWAQGGNANPSVKIAQYTSADIGNALPTSMMTRFDMAAVPSGAKVLTLAQDNNDAFTDLMGFRLHQIDGALQNSTHLLSATDLLTGSGLAWGPGDTLQAVWSGAMSSHWASGYTATGAATLAQQYMGLTAYTNLTTGARSALTRAADTAPVQFFNPQWSTSFIQSATPWMATEAVSWVAPFNSSSPTPPGMYSWPPNWGTAGCNFSYSGC